MQNLTLTQTQTPTLALTPTPALTISLTPTVTAGGQPRQLRRTDAERGCDRGLGRPLARQLRQRAARDPEQGAPIPQIPRPRSQVPDPKAPIPRPRCAWQRAFAAAADGASSHRPAPPRLRPPSLRTRKVLLHILVRETGSTEVLVVWACMPAVGWIAAQFCVKYCYRA